MLIIPAIDIIQGRVVRLYKGDFAREKFYSDDPVATASNWQRRGAEFLHIVDLEGAKSGEIKNRDIITAILKNVDVPCEVGGGLRDDKDIEYFLREGASRVVIGTRVIEDPRWLGGLIERFKDKVVAGIDSVSGRVAKKGWQEAIDISPKDMALKMQDAGIKTIVVTDIDVDGTLAGPNIDLLKEILDSVDISVIASGGIRNLEDIASLKKIKSGRLEAVIIGRALYEGKINLEEAIKLASQH